MRFKQKVLAGKKLNEQVLIASQNNAVVTATYMGVYDYFCNVNCTLLHQLASVIHQ